ncbi:MAG: hypothetical protein AB9869_11525 [Verrucomicrobiia bacterium]
MKVAALKFDKLVILDRASWDSIGTDPITRDAVRQLKDAGIVDIATPAAVLATYKRPIADAIRLTMADRRMSLPIDQTGVIVSNEGRLGSQPNAADPWPSIALIQQFVGRVQSFPDPHPGDELNWVPIASAAQPGQEHARWVGSLELEDLLGTDCHKAHIALTANETAKHLQRILTLPERFVAVTGADLRFEYLIDRRVIVEQVAHQLASQTAERT